MSTSEQFVSVIDSSITIDRGMGLLYIEIKDREEMKGKEANIYIEIPEQNLIHDYNIVNSVHFLFRFLDKPDMRTFNTLNRFPARTPHFERSRQEADRWLMQLDSIENLNAFRTAIVGESALETGVDTLIAEGFYRMGVSQPAFQGRNAEEPLRFCTFQ